MTDLYFYPSVKHLADYRMLLVRHGEQEELSQVALIRAEHMKLPACQATICNRQLIREDKSGGMSDAAGSFLVQM